MRRCKRVFALLLTAFLLLTACGSKKEGAQGDSQSSSAASWDRNSSEADDEGGESGDSSDSQALIDLGQGLVVQEIKAYAGSYVEDGSDETVDGVCAVTVKNQGSQTIQYGKLVLNQGDQAYTFEVSTLPPGACAQLLELSRQTMPDSLEGVTGTLESLAFFQEEPSLYEEIFQLETQDQAITIQNISDTDITGQIYVYYKITYGDLYMGGITYRVGQEGLKAGESSTCYAGHFSQDYSKVMFITYVP